MKYEPYDGEVNPWILPRASKVNPELSTRFHGLAKDYYAETGTPLKVTDSFRSSEEQADVYQRKPKLAAPPGKSRHEFGEALDIDQDQIASYGLDKWGVLLDKHGFVRPALSKGEHWHIELPRFEKAAKLAGPSKSSLVPYDGEVIPNKSEMVPYDGEVVSWKHHEDRFTPLPPSDKDKVGFQLPVEEMLIAPEAPKPLPFFKKKEVDEEPIPDVDLQRLHTQQSNKIVDKALKRTPFFPNREQSQEIRRKLETEQGIKELEAERGIAANLQGRKPEFISVRGTEPKVRTFSSDPSQEFEVGLMRGGFQTLGSLLGTIPQWAGKRFGSEKLTDTGREIADYFENKAAQFPQLKQYEGESLWDNPKMLADMSWWASSVGETVPSLVAAFAPGGLAYKALSWGGRAVKLTPQIIQRLAALGGAAGGGAAGGGLEAAQTYKEVLDRGGSEADADLAARQMAGAVSLLNALPVYKVLAPKGANKLVHYLTTGATEALTEWAEEPTEAIILGEPWGKVIQAAKEGVNIIPAAFLTGAGAAVVGGHAQEGGKRQITIPPIDQAKLVGGPGFVLGPSKPQFITQALQTLADSPGESKQFQKTIMQAYARIHPEAGAKSFEEVAAAITPEDLAVMRKKVPKAAKLIETLEGRIQQQAAQDEALMAQEQAAAAAQVQPPQVDMARPAAEPLFTPEQMKSITHEELLAMPPEQQKIFKQQLKQMEAETKAAEKVKEEKPKGKLKKVKAEAKPSAEAPTSPPVEAVAEAGAVPQVSAEGGGEGRGITPGDTMVDAIALSSPSGKMSKRTKEAAQERIRQELFGKEGLQRPMPEQPNEKETLLRQAKELRDLADRGMKPRAYRKQAEELEKRAAELEPTPAPQAGREAPIRENLTGELSPEAKKARSALAKEKGVAPEELEYKGIWELGDKKLHQFDYQFPDGKKTTWTAEGEGIAPDKVSKPRSPIKYDIDKAIEENDTLALALDAGGIDSKSYDLRNYEPEERRQLNLMVVRKGGVAPDDLFASLKEAYPGQFNRFEDAHDWIRSLLDGRYKRGLTKGGLEAWVNAELEKEATKYGLSPEELGEVERTAKREVAAEALESPEHWPEGITLDNFWDNLDTKATLEVRKAELSPEARQIKRAYPDISDEQASILAQDPKLRKQIATGNWKAVERAMSKGEIQKPLDMEGTDLFSGTQPKGKLRKVKKGELGAVGLDLDSPKVATTLEALKVEEAYEKAEADLKEQKSVKLKRVYEKLKRLTVDTSGNLKKELLKEAGVEGKEMVIRHDLSLGASAKAQSLVEDATAKIYDGLSKNQEILLNRALRANRDLTILKYKPDHRVTGGLSPAELQAYLDAMPEDITKRVKEYSAVMDANLKEMFDEGLLTEKGYKELKDKGDYLKTKYIQHMDPDRQGFDSRGRKITVPDSGIKKLEKGSEQAAEMNSRLLMAEVVGRTQGRIARNQANKALYQYIKDNPDNPFGFKLAKVYRKTKTPKGYSKEEEMAWEDVPADYDMTEVKPEPKTTYRWQIPTGHTEVSVMEKGKRIRMILPDKYAREWVQADPMLSPQLANIVGWLSGSKILKAFATGINPGFAMTNMPRDMAHIWLVTNEYSVFGPKAALQLGADLKQTFKDAITRKGAYQDYINEGGGMGFLTHQGELQLGGLGPIAKLQKYLAWVGETSEIWTRLALRNRAIKNGKSPIEATWEARNYLDFAQGGSLAKAVDTGIPYLNAGIQGTRKVFQAAHDDPKRFMLKVGQIGALAFGLYMANSLWNEDAWKQVPEYERRTNWIITTPITYRDKAGDKRYLYFRIAKDQGQRVFAALFEAFAAKMKGDQFDFNYVADAIGDALPLMPNEKLPPAFSAGLGYYANKDFWRNTEFWRGPKSVEASKQFDKFTHPAAVMAGKYTGLSPSRLQGALNNIIPATNTYAALVGAGLKQLMEDVPEKDREKTYAEMISNNALLNKLVRSTSPYEPFKKTIEETKTKEATRRWEQRQAIKKLVDANIEKPRAERYRIYREFAKQQPSLDRDRLIKSAEDHEKYYDIPDRAWWLNIKHMPPETRAAMYWGRYKDANPEDQQRLKKQMRSLPGIDSKRFGDELHRLERLERKTKPN